jgi:hypothetical protein
MLKIILFRSCAGYPFILFLLVSSDEFLNNIIIQTTEVCISHMQNLVWALWNNRSVSILLRKICAWEILRVPCFPSYISIQEGRLENIFIWHVVTVNMIIAVWGVFISKRLSSICRSKTRAISRTSERKTIVYQNTDKHIEQLVYRNCVQGENQDSLKTQPNSTSLQSITTAHKRQTLI